MLRQARTATCAMRERHAPHHCDFMCHRTEQLTLKDTNGNCSFEHRGNRGLRSIALGVIVVSFSWRSLTIYSALLFLLLHIAQAQCVLSTVHTCGQF